MKLLIDGEWVDSSSGRTAPDISPSTGNNIATFALANREDVESAIDSAEDAFNGWYALGSKNRSKIIVRAAEIIQNRRSELEDILITENGKVIMEARQEVDGVIDQLLYYAGFERKLPGDVLEGPDIQQRLFLHRVPFGVVVALTPWNFPAGMVARKLAPALLTGNTVVLKPSSDTPMAAEWIVKRFIEAGIPKGVLNFITGKGSEIGDLLVSHRKISLVTMTGSTDTGQRIMRKASENMAKLILELGGKAPFIVWRDANLTSALKTLLWAKFWNSGQSCIAAERLYIHEEVYDKFLEMLKKAVSRIKVGDPREADMGPLINRNSLNTMHDFVRDAITRGRRIISGGKVPSLKHELRNGFYFEPTVIEENDQGSPLFQEEIFGPIIGAMKVSDREDVFLKANDSKYGLASYLFTEDNEFIMEAFDRIRFGELYVNMPGPEASNGYHTGFRMTGQAGEGSVYGISEYLKVKNIYLNYGRDVSVPTVRESLISDDLHP